jgi:hypothetical protein
MPEKTNIELPRLDVVPESRCSQEVVDSVLDYLQESRPDLVAELMEYANTDILEYNRAFRPIMNFLREEGHAKVRIPQESLQILDIVFELHRRVLVAAGNKAPVVKGEEVKFGPAPLVSHLIKLSVFSPRNRDFLTGDYVLEQDFADSTLDMLCTRRPDILYELAEAERRLIPPPSAYGEYIDFMKEIHEEVPTEGKQRVKLWLEARKRVIVMCRIREKKERGV